MAHVPRALTGRAWQTYARAKTYVHTHAQHPRMYVCEPAQGHNHRRPTDCAHAHR